MKTNYLRAIISALVIAGSAISASAQTPPPSPPAPDISKLGPELKALIGTYRDSAKGLLAERKALLEQLKTATPAEIETLKTQIRAIMREHQQDQRELAKAIRDAIKARRDLQRKPSGG